MPSTAIEWAHWKDDVLSVKYRGGDAYDYFGVPEQVYRDYRATMSKGQFINFIVKPNYRYEKRPHELPPLCLTPQPRPPRRDRRS